MFRRRRQLIGRMLFDARGGRGTATQRPGVAFNPRTISILTRSLAGCSADVRFGPPAVQTAAAAQVVRSVFNVARGATRGQQAKGRHYEPCMWQ